MTRREPQWVEEDFDIPARIAALAGVEERVRQGLPPGSVISVTGMHWTPWARAAQARGVLVRHPMFTAIEPRRRADAGRLVPARPTSSSGRPASGRRSTTSRRSGSAPRRAASASRAPGRPTSLACTSSATARRSRRSGRTAPDAPRSPRSWRSGSPSRPDRGPVSAPDLCSANGLLDQHRQPQPRRARVSPADSRRRTTASRHILRRMTRGDGIGVRTPRAPTTPTERPLWRSRRSARSPTTSRIRSTVGPDFQPWRRNIAFSSGARGPDPRPPRRTRVSSRTRARWGYRFRLGAFEIPEADFEVIRAACVIE